MGLWVKYGSKTEGQHAWIERGQNTANINVGLSNNDEMLKRPAQHPT